MNVAFLTSHCRWPAVCIHGDKSQNERDWVLQGKVINNGNSIWHLIIVHNLKSM